MKIFTKEQLAEATILYPNEYQLAGQIVRLCPPESEQQEIWRLAEWGCQLNQPLGQNFIP